MNNFEDYVPDDRGFLEGLTEDLLTISGFGWLFRKDEPEEEKPQCRS